MNRYVKERKKIKMKKRKILKPLLMKIRKEFKIIPKKNVKSPSVYSFRIKELPEMTFGIFFTKEGIYYCGDFDDIMTKFRPKHLYISTQNIDDFIKLIKEIQENKKYHYVASKFYFQIKDPNYRRELTEEEVEAEYNSILNKKLKEMKEETRIKNNVFKFFKEEIFILYDNLLKVEIVDSGQGCCPRYDVYLYFENNYYNKIRKDEEFFSNLYMDLKEKSYFLNENYYDHLFSLVEVYNINKYKKIKSNKYYTFDR